MITYSDCAKNKENILLFMKERKDLPVFLMLIANLTKVLCS